MNITVKIREEYIKIYNINLKNLNNKVYRLVLKYDLNVCEIIELVRELKYNFEGVD